MRRRTCACCGKKINREDAYRCDVCGDCLCEQCYEENDGVCNECIDEF